MRSLQGLSDPVCPLVTERRELPLGTGLKGGVGGGLSQEVISPCIKEQFKQTSVGAVTVRRRNALPVRMTLPSVICGPTVTI